VDLRVVTILSSSSAIARAGGVAVDAVCDGSVLALTHRVASPSGAADAYECRAPDDPRTALIVKVYRAAEVSIASRIRVVRDLHATLGSEDPDRLARHAFRGCPFAVGEAVLADERVVFSVASDLRPAGFIALDDVLENVARFREYLQLPLEHRLAIALDLARAYEAFERLRYVHGGIAAANAVVSLRASASGSRDVLGAFVNFDEPGAKVGRHAERAALAGLLGQVVFAASPAAADPASQARMYAELQQLSDPLVAAFRRTIDGDHTGSGLSARQWIAALTSPGQAPEFAALDVSRRGAVAGDTVTVRWHALRARDVHVTGAPTVSAPDGETTIVVRRSGPVRVVARNAFGTTEAWTEPVRVFDTPTIVEARVPAPPRIVVRAPSIRVTPPVIEPRSDALADALVGASRDRLVVESASPPPATTTGGTLVDRILRLARASTSQREAPSP
jgi:hypothetical protein